jgi:hypothetical protein
MFYHDDDVAVIDLGAGDMLLMGSHIEGDESIGTLSFIDNCGKCHPIGKKVDEDKWKLSTKHARYDTDLNTVVRIVFKNIESLDSLMAELRDVWEQMKKHVK